MWELLQDVLWIAILCIVGIAVSLTYIACLLVHNRKELFKEKTEKPTHEQIEELDSEVFTIIID